MEDKKYDIRFDTSWYGFAIGATLMLIILKCLNMISCSWWWVFSPVLFMIAWTVFIVFIIGLIAIYYVSTGKFEEDIEKFEKEINEDSDNDIEIEK